MKLLKGVGGIFSCILLSVGILLFVIQDISGRIVLDRVVDVIVDRMVSASLNQVLPEGLQENSFFTQASEELAGPLSAEIKEQIDAVKTEMMSSHYLQDMSKKYIDAVLGKLIDGEAQLPDVGDEIQNLAQEYVPRLSQTLGVEVSSERVTQISDAIAKRVDINGFFEELTQHMQLKLSPAQKQVLRLIRFFNHGSLIWFSVAIMVIACVLLLISKRSLLLWLSYVGVTAMICGMVFMGCGKLIPLLWQKTSDPLIEILSSAGSEMMELLFWEGISIATIGILLVLMYGAGNAIKHRFMTKKA